MQNVLRNKTVAIGLFSILAIFSFISTAEAELWELLIDLNVEKGTIHPGETVRVTGKVVDHAYEPIRGAEVLIRTDADTTKAFTDPRGVFVGEFKDFQRIPGTYTVNVIADWYGMTGLSSTEFQVKGESSPISHLQSKLSTEEAKKYLSSNEEDFEKNPIGQTLFKYYHKLLEQLIKEKKEYDEPQLDQIHVEQQRKIAEQLRKQAIEEFQPGDGKYEGYRYDRYMNSLDPKVRDLVATQLNFTKNNFEDAQKIREKILSEGGTIEEARQAYLDRISISKDSLEQFNQEKTHPETDLESTEIHQENSEAENSEAENSEAENSEAENSEAENSEAENSEAENSEAENSEAENSEAENSEAENSE